ncbi:DUF3052 domain-containing protein [Bacillus suaedaesalsae]|uniref:DUF3052 domain-containing protein n=1 Tax=Bacillus suaedaesalsae TaxID=2810349 RepID=A0ABS2DEG2_9BACI|nr:DUF3052 domain-containing protein [Bacillus suaedaesalsae]MBM6616853.1 DUF3052 domain-containing protein [Bacillus suaedaesalsae]
MNEIHPILKKLNVKDLSKPILILNAPKEYQVMMASFDANIHTEIKDTTYSFVQLFGTSNEEIQELGFKATEVITEDGLLWLCYPKKSSKVYKGLNCSRDTVAPLLASQGYEPVRQVAVDEDWSALRFRLVTKIKTMTRGFAHTDEGKLRTNS